MFEKKEILPKNNSTKMKKKLESKKNLIKISDNKIVNYISYIGIVIIFLLSIFILNNINSDNFKIYEEIEKVDISNLSEEEKNKIKLLEKRKEELKQEEIEKKLKEKSDKEKTNILIIWRWWYSNDAPELTDSLILLSYYESKNHVSMLSIPRDLYVDYNIDKKDLEKNSNQIKWKINALYVTDLEKTQDREKSIKKLEAKIEEITNEKIDFYVNIDFRGFVKLIDSIWGVKVNVIKTLVDEEYPDNNHWFKTFVLRKWNWNLDWATALKYVRSRKNTGWDFWRSERQQQVIKSLKEKVLSSEYLTSPSKIKNLYNIFDKYISTDIWLVDFIQLATSVKLKDNLQFNSSTLNTTCIKDDECNKWGFLFYPQRKYFWWQSVLLSGDSTYQNLWNYDKIHTYSNLIFNTPNIFRENFKISIFSNLENREDAFILRQELKKYWLKINVLEKIWFIPNNFITEKWWHWEKKEIKNTAETNKLTLLEYNKLKKEGKLKNINTSSLEQKITSEIWKEAHNKNTKIIINWTDINSNTINFLVKYLQLKKSDIIINEFWPKYAKDENTKIEILFKNN